MTTDQYYMVPFIVSRLLLIMVVHFLLLGREVLALDALIFCLLGFLLVLCGVFFAGVGAGDICVCVFSFFLDSSICSWLVQIHELILFFCGLCDVMKANIPGELRMFSIPSLFSSEHFVSCLVCACIKQRFC